MSTPWILPCQTNITWQKMGTFLTHFFLTAITVGFSNDTVMVHEGKTAQVCVALLSGNLGTDIVFSIETDIGNYSGTP